MSIKAVDLNFVYGAGTAFEQKALKHVNFEIQDGEFVGLIGPHRVREVHADSALKRAGAGDQRPDSVQWGRYLRGRI